MFIQTGQTILQVDLLSIDYYSLIPLGLGILKDLSKLPFFANCHGATDDDSTLIFRFEDRIDDLINAHLADLAVTDVTVRRSDSSP